MVSWEIILDRVCVGYNSAKKKKNRKSIVNKSVDLPTILQNLPFLLEFWELGAWNISISWFVWLLDLC